MPGDACRCGWRRRPAGRCQPGSSGAGELRAQDLAGAFSQIGGPVEARKERRQLLLSGGVRSIAIDNGDVESLPRLYAVATKLGHQLSLITSHDQVPLVGCVSAAHPPLLIPRCSSPKGSGDPLRRREAAKSSRVSGSLMPLSASCSPACSERRGVCQPGICATVTPVAHLNATATL
jgi:hypothetical protein